MKALNADAMKVAHTELQEKSEEAERKAGFHGRLFLELVYVNNKIVGVDSYLKHQRKF